LHAEQKQATTDFRMTVCVFKFEDCNSGK